MTKVTFSFSAILILFSAMPVSAQVELPPSSDVRVLIDISGSMKKNDPENLRRPALNLITELLPASSTAGVWTFGQYVNELVPHGPVTESWRALAREKSNEINSVALYTNIGAVLERASRDLQADQSHENTHFILLTDGVVDVSQDSRENVEERQRIRDDVLAGLKATGAKVHTIALSRNADQGLLQQLSAQTAGINSLAESSEELSKVFLQAFDRAAPAEEVPIDDNKFFVDSSVEEFTALLFHEGEAGELALVEPSGKRFSREERPPYVRWLREKSYDLITVKGPLEGEWQLDAELAPGSRVTVVSSLRLVVDPLPATFYAGDQLEVQAGFFEDGELVTKREFLEIVKVDVTIQMADGKSGTKTISPEGEAPEDGIFREQVRRLKEVGRYQVIVAADGKTFQRKARQLITLNAPMSVELEATGSGEATQYRVVITPLSQNIDPEQSKVVAKIKGPDGNNLIKAIAPEEGPRWVLDVEPHRGEGLYEVGLRIDGKTNKGGQFRLDPESFIAEFPRQEASPNDYRSLLGDDEVANINETLTEQTETAEPVAEETPQPESIVPAIDPAALEQAQREQTEAATTEETPQETEAGTNWLTIGLAIGGVVLLLGLAAGFLIFRKKKAQAAEPEVVPEKVKEERKLVADEPPAPEPEAEEAPVAPPGEEVAPEPDALDPDDMEFSLEDLDDSDGEDDVEAPAEAESPPQTDNEPVEQPAAEPAPEETEDLMAQPDPEAGGTERQDSAEQADAAENEEQESDKDSDLDDEFNLEDFDISDTDDLQLDPEDKDKK